MVRMNRALADKTDEKGEIGLRITLLSNICIIGYFNISDLLELSLFFIDFLEVDLLVLGGVGGGGGVERQLRLALAHPALTLHTCMYTHNMI